LQNHYDVVILGGGPTGLSAALILGRCRRRVLVVDSGRPRNAAARAMHGYLTRDGTPPREVLRMGREEAARYGVALIDGEATEACCLGDAEPSPAPAFAVTLADGRSFRARKLLLATGVRDVLPEIDGVATYYGRGVHHCPYCDGWEHRDDALAAYGATAAKAVGLALSLRTWSARVTALTDGEPIPPEDLDRLRRNGIAVRTEPIARLEGSAERLERVVLASGPPLPCDGFFFNTDQLPHSTLAERLGCRSTEKNHVATHGKQRTGVPGLFVAGDADGDVQFVIVAAAEGARAAVAINRELQDEDRGEAGS
jgi:thioredoxin reductase